MVYGVRPTSLLVFVPKFHMKGSVHLTDRAGLVRLPLTAPGQNTDDAFAVSERRQYRLETGIACSRHIVWADIHLVCMLSRGSHALLRPTHSSQVTAFRACCYRARKVALAAISCICSLLTKPVPAQSVSTCMLTTPSMPEDTSMLSGQPTLLDRWLCNTQHRVIRSRGCYIGGCQAL